MTLLSIQLLSHKFIPLIRNQVDQLKQTFISLHSAELAENLAGLVSLHAITSRNDAPIQEIVSLNAVPVLFKFLQSDINEVIFESLCSLANISASINAYAVSILDNQGLDVICHFLNSDIVEIKETAIRILSNLIVIEKETRNYAYSIGAFDLILNFFKTTSTENEIGLRTVGKGLQYAYV